MNEHPILFSAPMVKAILEGRKTQTRRVCKVQPPAWTDRVDAAPLVDGVHRHGEAGQWVAVSNEFVNVRCIGRCPYGEAGDRLWVRETWQAMNTEMKWWHEWPANDRSSMNWAWTNPVKPAYDLTPPKWLPAIHMPRMACRIMLEVLNVRVERVQDISEEDAIAEGMDENALVFGLESGAQIADDQKCRAQFAELWDSINAKRGYGWDANPWVWVIEFKQVQS